eukprot:6024591-Pyramimonas_sp.AAC.1
MLPYLLLHIAVRLLRRDNDHAEYSGGALLNALAGRANRCHLRDLVDDVRQIAVTRWRQGAMASDGV